MAEQVDASPGVTTSTTSAVPVEPLDGPIGAKENQSRESSLSGLSARSPASTAIVEITPGSASTATGTSCKQVGVAPGSNTSVSSPRTHDHDSATGPVPLTASFKRSPVRVGYLFKQSSGPWNRKRWNQRWFVLDNETGVFKYFRHESLPEAVPFRQDAHGVIHLKEPGASLVIQGDLPRNVPTPFCFTVCDRNRSFLICADTNQEFREWTSAISAILSPRKSSTVESVAPGRPTKRASTESALDTAVALPRSAPPTLVVDTLPIPRPIVSKRLAREVSSDVVVDVRPTLRQTLQALLVLNPLAVVIRYASIEWVYASLFVVNIFLVWVLWFKEQPPVPRANHFRLEDSDVTELASEESSADMGSLPPCSPSPSGTTSPRGDSPRKQTLPRLEKIPSASFQPTKFLGVVNGTKAKAGESVKMCPPAPAAFVSGCWTQISGTRFQVRQGPNYRRTKLKAPSEESLLDLVAVDIYRSPSKIDNIASIIDLGELKPDVGPLDLFVVNCQVPSYQPSNPLWGEKQGNGEGFNFVCFFAIPPGIREQINQHEPSQQAVRLLKNFMQDNSSVRDRFKAIGIVVNPQEQKLGRTERHLLETYNGQPILTRPQHRFFRGDGYFEVDVDAHEFNFVARKGLVGVSEHFRNMVVDFGYVIEGQEDAELPEQILGAVRLCKIDVRQALEIA